jgi:protein TonB
MTGHFPARVEVVMAVTADKRPLGALGRMGVVAAMHLAVLLVLARSFGIVPGTKMPESIDLVPVADPTPIDPAPPLPDYKPDAHEVLLSAPEVPPVDSDQNDGGISVKFVPPEKLTGGQGTSDVIPQDLLEVRADPKHPLTQPPYPPSLIRAGKEGAVDLEIYVLSNGRVGDARLLRTSGFEDFDRSALQEARRNWRMLPASRGGETFAQWYRLRVVFKLQNAR